MVKKHPAVCARNNNTCNNVNTPPHRMISFEHADSRFELQLVVVVQAVLHPEAAEPWRAWMRPLVASPCVCCGMAAVFEFYDVEFLFVPAPPEYVDGCCGSLQG